jgi:hypothetical protein
MGRVMSNMDRNKQCDRFVHIEQESRHCITSRNSGTRL